MIGENVQSHSEADEESVHGLPTALSFLITAPLYSLAPGLLRAIFGGMVLIPTALILRRLIDRTLFPILNTLLVFYFVDQLRLITAALPLLHR